MSATAPLRIGVIGLKGLPAAGGGARAGEAVLERLAGRHRFTVFAMASHASDPEPIPGVRQVILPSPGPRQARLAAHYATAAAAALLRHRFDLVHLHHGMAGWVAPPLRLRFPLVITLHGSAAGIAREGRLGRLGTRATGVGERLALRWCDRVVTVAEPHLDYYRARGAPDVRWIPNGVDRVDLAGRRPTEEDYIAFAAARILPVKGLHLLLEAVRSASIRTPVLALGDVGLDAGYERRIRGLADGLDVRLPGLERDRGTLLGKVRDARAFVFPSITEAMSNMLLEAVMVGVPVVCSDIPENRAILAEDEAAFFRAGSADDLARVLSRVLDRPDEARARAARARRRLSDRYDWDRVADAYDDLYRSLVAEGPRL